MFNRLRWLGLLLTCLFFGTAISASAQDPASATLFPPDTTSFPQIRTFLDVHNPDGSFAHGLQASDLRVLEDDQPLPVSDLSELRPGVQMVFAINPGDSFTIRNAQGRSRYDFIQDALLEWAYSRSGSNLDDLSLIVTPGPVHTHTGSPQEFIDALETYQIEDVPVNPSLDLLLQALDVASDATPRAGMEQAILFVTSPIAGDITLGLQDLVTRALEQRVHIYIWYVTSPDLFDSQGARQLSELAAQTGGEFYTFSGEEPIPSPEMYLNNLRDIYLLSYETRVNSGGTHQLVVEIQNGDEKIVTPALEYDLSLLPPDPAFISPVAEINRQVPDGEGNGVMEQTGIADLVPKEQPLEILIDFPDGRTRPLVATKLYIDDQFVAENTQPPFDQFVWDLSVYTTTARHVLQVEALDSLGLVGRSIETPVEVKVEVPGANPLAFLFRNIPAMIGLVILLSGAVVFLYLILSGRIQPRALRVPAGFNYARRKNTKKDASQSSQPVEAFLRSDADERRFSGWVSRLHWPQRRLTPQAYASLVPVLESDESTSENPISIDSNEITLGSDRNMAVLAIDDPTVEGLHARLVRNDDGTFTLIDEGSVSGTWINYTQVSPKGTSLQHGDMIHIGRVAFQFKLRDSRQVRKPVIIRERISA